jgi:hypothetical protein
VLSSLLCTTCERLLVAREVVEHAVCNDGKVFGEVERRGDDEEREEEEEYRVCCGVLAESETGGIGGRTEDELLGARQHVQREGDFVLVSLALEPTEQRGRVEHCGEDEGGGGGEEDDGCEGRGIEHSIEAD